MTIIKTQTNFYNFNNIIDIYIENDSIKLTNVAGGTNTVYRNEDIEIVKQIYANIQKSIGYWFENNKHFCLDIEEIEKRVLKEMNKQ